MTNAGLIEINRCEVCGGSRLHPVIDLGLHPMCDDLVAVGDDRVCSEFPIDILYCDTCRTAHQRFQIPKRLLFPTTYHYRSRQTLDVLNGMRLLVDACESSYGSLTGKKVLDVGCNDGSLLSIFAQRGAETFGIEPTGASVDAAAAGHNVINDFLSEDVARDVVRRFGHPSIVTFTNVFAHIEDLGAVIRALEALSNADTKIVIENHYLGAILAKRQFDTFYHEHPRTYSFTSFEHIAASLGMSVARVEFPDRYGGNIRVFLDRGDRTAVDRTALHDRERSFGDDLVRLSQHVERWKGRKHAQVAALVRQHGALSAKAFPGRAAIPIRMLKLDRDAIAAVYEKPGSPKIGHYVPGTRIPIMSDDDFATASHNAPIVNLAWHIAREIEGYMRSRGFSREIVDIIADADFAE